MLLTQELLQTSYRKRKKEGVREGERERSYEYQIDTISFCVPLLTTDSLWQDQNIIQHVQARYISVLTIVRRLEEFSCLYAYCSLENSDK